MTTVKYSEARKAVRSFCESNPRAGQTVRGFYSPEQRYYIDGYIFGFYFGRRNGYKFAETEGVKDLIQSAAEYTRERAEDLDDTIRDADINGYASTYFIEGLTDGHRAGFEKGALEWIHVSANLFEVSRPQPLWPWIFVPLILGAIAGGLVGIIVDHLIKGGLL